MKLFVIVSVISFIVATLGFIGACFYNVFVRKKEIPLDTLDLSKTHYAPFEKDVLAAISEIKALPSQLWEIKSGDGLTLRGRYYNFGNGRLAVLVHGYRAVPYNNNNASFLAFRDMGFDILLISSRAHSESEGRFITFGIREREDLLKWIDFAEKKVKPESLVVYGTSMGAATLAYASPELQSHGVSAAVLDCGFKTPYDTIYNSIRGGGIFSKIAMGFIYITGKIFLGVDIIKENTRDYLRDCSVPAYFIHGKLDNVVDPESTVEGFEKCGAGLKDIMLVDNAGHVEAFLAARPLLTKNITEFFGKAGIKL